RDQRHLERRVDAGRNLPGGRCDGCGGRLAAQQSGSRGSAGQPHTKQPAGEAQLCSRRKSRKRPSPGIDRRRLRPGYSRTQRRAFRKRSTPAQHEISVAVASLKTELTSKRITSAAEKIN